MSAPRLARRALGDLEGIRAYIARESVAAADRFLDRVSAKIRAIGEAPGIGRPRDELGPGVRSCTVGVYVILYHATPDRVVILGVAHGAQDIEGRYGTDADRS